MSELHSWAKLLGGEVSGDEIVCPGPGHTPKDRSLSVKIGRDGEPIVHSFCPADNDLECKDFARKLLGMEPFKPKGNGKASSTKRHFDYPGPDGALLYQVEREDLPDGSKKIRQRRPDGKGGWAWNLSGVHPVPYRLPELLEALANGRMVAIVEGEAKADLLWSWNVPATCNSGGAGNWKGQHSAYLRRADVIIMPDNDESGRKHAGIVAASLMEAGATVRILDLPSLPPKGDIIDWAVAGGTVEQLHALIECDARPYEAATAWAPGEASNRQDKGEAPRPVKPSLAIEWFGEAADSALSDPGDQLIEGVLDEGALSVIYGDSGSGKTFVALDMAFHVGAGLDWNGKKVKRGLVVYVAAEGGRRNCVKSAVVEWEIGPSAKAAGMAKQVPRGQRLLMSVIELAIEEAGVQFMPFSDGPLVPGVKDAVARAR